MPFESAFASSVPAELPRAAQDRAPSSPVRIPCPALVSVPGAGEVLAVAKLSLVSALRTRNPGPGIRRSRSRDRGFMLRDRGPRLLAAGWSCVQISFRLFRTRDAVVSRRHSMREAKCGPFRHTKCRMRREKVHHHRGTDSPGPMTRWGFSSASSCAGAPRLAHSWRQLAVRILAAPLGTKSPRALSLLQQAAGLGISSESAF